MKAVRVKVDLSRPATLPKGRIDRRKLDATTEAELAVQQAQDDAWGFIDKRKMRAYDALCLAPVPEYDAQRIRELRESLHLSQSVLAAVLNTSVSTVRKREIGDKKP